MYNIKSVNLIFNRIIFILPAHTFTELKLLNSNFKNGVTEL